MVDAPKVNTGVGGRVKVQGIVAAANQPGVSGVSARQSVNAHIGGGGTIEGAAVQTGFDVARDRNREGIIPSTALHAANVGADRELVSVSATNQFIEPRKIDSAVFCCGKTTAIFLANSPFVRAIDNAKNARRPIANNCLYVSYTV